MNRWLLPFGPFDQRLANPTGRRSAADLADLLGVAPRTIVRWRAHGIPAPAADRAATRIGLHPHDIWDPLFYDLAEDLHELTRHRHRPHPHGIRQGVTA
jgi:hypothetical protein